MLCRAIPYEGQEPYVFLSYCHHDASQVYPILEQMVLDGYRVWYDDGNHAGDDWVENIAQHLSGCHICLAFISEHSSQSHNCKNEVNFAIQCKKKLSTVLLEDFAMSKGMRMQLSSFHYLKKNDFPSEKMLLQKLYETEEMKACHTKPGSLPMRIIEADLPSPSKSSQLDSEIHDFVAQEKKQGIKASIVELPPETPDPEQSENPPVSAVEPPASDLHVPAKKVVKIRRKAAPPETVTEEFVPKSDTASDQAIVPENDAAARSEYDPGSQQEPEENQEQAQSVSSDESDEEKTIYQRRPLPEADADEDEERTVRTQHSRTAVLLQPSTGKGYELQGIQVKIGRSHKRCDIVLTNNPSISNYHADIIMGHNQCSLRDAGSSYGTFINGERLEKGKEVILSNPSVFWFSDELLILVSGYEAKEIISQGCALFLLNASKTSVRFLMGESLLLNRNHKWNDGTLSDLKIHREKHAQICRKEDGFYLEDMSPVNGNGTYLNEQRLLEKESRKVKAGDFIRLGDTVLEVGIVTL